MSHSTRRPGRDKRGTADQDRWPGGIWIAGRYLPPIAGAESNPPPAEKPADDKPKQDAPSEGNGTPGDKPKPDADKSRLMTTEYVFPKK